MGGFLSINMGTLIILHLHFRSKLYRIRETLSEMTHYRPKITMSQHEPNVSESGSPALDRRRVLQGMAAAGVTGMAGCLGGGDDGDDGNGDGDSGPDFSKATQRVDVDLEDVPDEPTGRLEFAIERSGIGSYDQANSTTADDSIPFNVVYDSLIEQNTEGEQFNWMAKEYSAETAQDVGPADYTDYMGEYEITAAEDGEGSRLQFPELNIERPNLVLIRHPDDVAAFSEGNLNEGDTFRALTREEAPDAVEDGVFGVRVTGTLHEGIEFHNGEELTAGNIISSYDRFVGSNNQGQVFDTFLAATAPNGEDGYEFELYAQEADATAEIELPPLWIFPSEHTDVPPGDLEPRQDGPVPIGTGPYQIEEYEEGSQLLLSRVENYWVEEVGVENLPYDVPDEFPGGPMVEEINIRFVPEGGTRVAGLQDGDIDVSYQLPAGDRTTFLEDEDYRVAAAPSTGFLFMQLPVAGGGPLGEQGVRQAISALMPRQNIVDVVEEGWASPARVPIPQPAAGAGSTMSYEDLESQDWAYNVQPDVEQAEQLINDAGVETPISLTIETNADDEDRQDKMQLAVDQLNQSDLFEAELETPGEISEWISQNLYASDALEVYSEEQRVAVVGLAAGFDPHGYAQALHSPDNYNICCNFLHPEGTFDWIDLLRSCRFDVDAAEDPQVRRQRYDELWPQLVNDAGNMIIDYSLETLVAGPNVEGYNGYPDRRPYLSYCLYAPYDEQIVYLNE